MGWNEAFWRLGARRVLQQVSETYYQTSNIDWDSLASTSLASLHIGHFPTPDPSNVDPEVIKLGIHSEPRLFFPIKDIDGGCHA